MTLKKISREETEDEFREKVVFNFRAIENHGIELPDNPTAAQVADVLRRLLDLLSGKT